MITLTHFHLELLLRKNQNIPIAGKVASKSQAWNIKRSAAKEMKEFVLIKELVGRFPEVLPSMSEGDEELPYIVTDYLIDWLRTEFKAGPKPKIADRLVSFSNWVKSDPKVGSEDITTPFVVGIVEKLFEHPELTCLVPRIMSKSELLENEKYLTSWVGEANYRRALNMYSLRQDKPAQQ